MLSLSFSQCLYRQIRWRKPLMWHARLDLYSGEFPLYISTHFLLIVETLEKEVIWVWENKGFSEEIKIRLECFVNTICYMKHDVVGTTFNVGCLCINSDPLARKSGGCCWMSLLGAWNSVILWSKTSIYMFIILGLFKGSRF